MIVLYILLFPPLALLAVFFLLFLFSLPINPHREYEKESAFYRFLLNFSTAVALKLALIHVHCEGTEKVPQGRPVLFAGNHRSRFDPIITWYVFRAHKPAFISKASNFKVPVFGRIIRKCCFMAIDRENPRNAIKTVNKAAELMIRGQNSVGVYPEGTRSRTGVLLPFHDGVFRIAQKASSDTVVLAVRGTEKISKNYPFHVTHVYLDVLAVIPAEEIKGKRTGQIGGYVRDMLERYLDEKEKT